MAVRTELSLRLPNSPGAMADVCRLLSTEQVNVVALSLEAGGTLRLFSALVELGERHVGS